MAEFILYIFDRIWPPLLAVYLTQKFIKWRMPKLNILSEERVSILNDRFYAWRFLINNKKSMDWLPLRETATNCQAKIEVFKGHKEVFKMRGRWANSAEIPDFPHDDQRRIVLYPEPISIRSGQGELLDGIVQYPNEKVAYGWNNEAYFNGWKTKAYKLEIGQYRVIVTISPQNGPEVSGEFKLTVSDNYIETCLTPILNERTGFGF